MKLISMTLAALLAFVSHAAWSHGDSGHKAGAKKTISTEEKPFGREGDAKKATRTIKIGMADTMRFTPSEITVKPGETVRFVASNGGKIMHEMVLGTMKELKEHAEVMKKHPGMEHDAPYMAHIAPGKSGDIVWQFTKPGEFYYACLIPGHFEAGMIGKVVVK